MFFLLNKQAKPGDGAFSLTGQPKCLWNSREKLEHLHRLPADMMVAVPKHRAVTEKAWNIPWNKNQR